LFVDTWGYSDVQAAVNTIPLWLALNDWDGLGVDISKILLAGHSNGGMYCVSLLFVPHTLKTCQDKEYGTASHITQTNL